MYAYEINKVKNYENKDIEDAIALRKSEIQKQATSFDEIQIGDIFVDSWGYDMTIVDWYQVVGKVGKATLIVRAVKSKWVSEWISGTGETVPSIDDFCSDEIRVRVQDNQYGLYFKNPIGYHEAIARPWDGRPHYENHND